MTKASERVADAPRLLSRADVQHMLGVSHSTLRSMVRAGQLPGPLVMPGGSHRYLESEILAFQEQLVAQRDSREAHDT